MPACKTAEDVCKTTDIVDLYFSDDEKKYN